MKFRRIIAGLAALGVASALPVMAGGEECKHDGHKNKDKHASMSKHESQYSTGQALRLSKITNAKVMSRDGERLGELEDVVINPQTGKIQFAILGHGGLLGVGEERIPVPWEQFSYDAEQKQFSLAVNEDKLASAPKLDGDYSDLNDPSFASRVNEFYGESEDVGGSVDLESSSPESIGGSKDMDRDMESESSSDSGRTGNWSDSTDL